MKLIALVSAIFAASATPALAQPSIDWYTIDGGGGFSSGGGFTLRGTVGQPDAATSSGSGYALVGGFWGAVSQAGPCNSADLVPPFGVTDLSDVDAFIPAFLAADPSVDFVAPFGIVDLSDLDVFISAFLAGCP
ncbi:MAG: GC-type dockerin domain-anchored protein [Planctomycetota bacterium]